MLAHVVRVFVDGAGRHGNPLGIVLDAAGMGAEERQEAAGRLNFSETVFVEDAAAGRIRIHTPAAEVALAGHPLVGAAWFLARRLGAEVRVLRPALAGPVDTWQEDGLTWVRARIDDAPDWRFVQLTAPAEVEALAVPPAPEYDLHEFWAWQDAAAGRLRARVFASRYGIAEDEATGSGALRLAALLGRPLTIAQGRGSLVYARPAAAAGFAEIGGRVAGDGERRV